MVTEKSKSTANDNSPSLHHLHGRLQNHMAARRAKTQPNLHATQNVQIGQTKPTDDQRKAKSLRLTQILWLASLLSVIAAMLFSAPVEFKAFSLIALLWMSLWSSYVFANHKLPRLKEIAVLSTMACLLSAFALIANSLALSIAPLDGIILAALGPLVLAAAMKSRIALLFSISASLIWAIFAPQGASITTPLLFLFPLMAIFQAYIGTKINSGLTIGLSIITGCLLYTSPSPRDLSTSRMPSSA